jgi:hypothetical protein
MLPPFLFDTVGFVPPLISVGVTAMTGEVPLLLLDDGGANKSGELRASELVRCFLPKPK